MGAFMVYNIEKTDIEALSPLADMLERLSLAWSYRWCLMEYVVTSKLLLLVILVQYDASLR